MPRVRVLHGAAYEDDLFEYLTDRQIDKAESLERNLSYFPDMGSPVVQQSLIARYGSDLRKLIVDDYVLVYRHDEDAVRMLAAVPGKSIG